MAKTYFHRTAPLYGAYLPLNCKTLKATP